MSSAGHIMDMINRMRQNRNNRPSVRRKMRPKRWDGSQPDPHHKYPARKPSAIPPEKLRTVRAAIKKKAAKAHRKDLVLYGIAILIAVLVVVVLLVFMLGTAP